MPTAVAVEVVDAGAAALPQATGPMTVFTVGESPMTIGVIGKTLVWTDSAGALWTMPARGGGSPAQLSNQHQPGRPMLHSVVAHGGAMITNHHGRIMRVELPNGPVTEIADIGVDGNSIIDLASDGSAIYGTWSNTDEVWKYADGKKTKLFDHGKASIVVTGDTLYSVSYSKGTVFELKTAGGKPRTLVSGLPKPTGFTADDKFLYVWCERDGDLRKIDRATGKITVIAKDGLENSDWLVADGDWIYTNTWLGEGASKFVRVAKDGSAVQVLADKLTGPYGIAADEEAVFLAVRDENRIIRFDKRSIQPL